MLNYLGQGVLIRNDPSTAVNPFFLMVPDWAQYPMLFLATAATIIASQAAISGSYRLPGRRSSWGTYHASPSCTPQRSRGRSTFRSSTGGSVSG